MMEDIRTYRTYRIEEDEARQTPDEERVEWGAASEDEVPFHIPRD